MNIESIKLLKVNGQNLIGLNILSKYLDRPYEQVSTRWSKNKDIMGEFKIIEIKLGKSKINKMSKVPFLSKEQLEKFKLGRKCYYSNKIDEILEMYDNLKIVNNIDELLSQEEEKQNKDKILFDGKEEKSICIHETPQEDPKILFDYQTDMLLQEFEQKIDARKSQLRIKNEVINGIYYIKLYNYYQKKLDGKNVLDISIGEELEPRMKNLIDKKISLIGKQNNEIKGEIPKDDKYYKDKINEIITLVVEHKIGDYKKIGEQLQKSWIYERKSIFNGLYSTLEKQYGINVYLEYQNTNDYKSYLEVVEKHGLLKKLYEITKARYGSYIKK